MFVGHLLVGVAELRRAFRPIAISSSRLSRGRRSMKGLPACGGVSALMTALPPQARHETSTGESGLTDLPDLDRKGMKINRRRDEP
jgi:hypothetical protein